MKFDVTEHVDGIHVWLSGPDPWQAQTFFPLIDRLLGQIREAIDREKKRVIFDFTALNFIDSYMISMLVQCSRYTDPLRNILIVPDEQVRSIVSLVGLEHMMNVYVSMDDWKSSE